MTVFKNDGVQVMQYLYDFAEDGGVKDVQIVLSDKPGKIPLPVGALVKNVTAVVLVAPLSTGSATVEWGNDDTDGYSGTAVAKATLAINYAYNGKSGTAPGALLWDDTNDAEKAYRIADSTKGKFGVLINVENLTAGKILFLVEFLMGSVEA